MDIQEFNIQDFDTTTIKLTRKFFLNGDKQTGVPVLLFLLSKLKDLQSHKVVLYINTSFDRDRTKEQIMKLIFPNMIISNNYDGNDEHFVKLELLYELAKRDSDKYLIIIDHVNCQSFFKYSIIEKMFMNGQNHGITIVMTSSSEIIIPSSIRCQMDYIFIYRNKDHRLKTHEYIDKRNCWLFGSFFGLFDSDKSVQALMRAQFSDGHDRQCIVVDTTNNCNSFEGTYFKFLTPTITYDIPKCLPLEKFEMNTLKPYSNIVLCGKRQSGVSTLALDIIHNLILNHDVHIVVQFVHQNGYPSVPLETAHSQMLVLTYSKSAVETLLKDIISKPLKQHMIVMFDNIIEKDALSHDAIKNLMSHNQSYGVTFIVCAGYIFPIPPEIRPSIDYIFAFRENIRSNKQRLWEYFNPSGSDSFQTFCTTMDKATRPNFQSMVIHDGISFTYRSDINQPNVARENAGVSSTTNNQDIVPTVVDSNNVHLTGITSLGLPPLIWHTDGQENCNGL